MNFSELIDKYGFADDEPQSVAKRRLSDPMTSSIFDQHLDKYYDNIGVFRNRRFIKDFVRVQSNYNHMNYSKSYGCLYVPLTADTIQPGMFGQLDANWFDIVENVYLKVMSKMPEYENEFSKVFTLMGALPDKLDIIPPSAGISRLENGLPFNPPEKFLQFLREFIAFMFEELYFIPDDFVFKISSSGNPGLPGVIKHEGSLIEKNESAYSENSFKIFKKAQVLNFANNLKDQNFIESLDKMDLGTLFCDYGLLFFYTDQHRSQPDKSTKDRFVRTKSLWDPEFYGRHEISDAVKKVDKSFSIKKFFRGNTFEGKTFADKFQVQCKKWRFVFAESASTNQQVNLCLSALRKNLGTIFGNTYKCSDAITVTKILTDYIEHHNINLADYDVIDFDIMNFDNNVCQAINIAYCEGISKVSDNLAKFIFVNSNAPGVTSVPYANPDPRTARNELFFTGNSFSLHTFNMGVSPSGVADVSERAKLINSAFILYTLLEDFNAADCYRILKGEDKYFKFLNLGDNNFILSHKKFNMVDKLRNSQVFKVELDDNYTFGGLNMEINKTLNKINVFESPNSTMIKVLTPERPLDDPMRSSYALGTINRYELANNNWRTACVLDSIDESLFNKFRAVSQLELAKKRIGDKDYDKSKIYEQLTKFLGENPLSSVSSFFMQVLDSGGDKLFYTDLYDKLQDFEKKIVDYLFFTVIERDKIQPILDYFNLKERSV